MSNQNVKTGKVKFNLGSNNVKKTFFAILIPTLIAQLISGTYIIFDTWFVSNGFHAGPIFDGIGQLGNDSASYASLGIAAISYAMPYTFFIIGIGLAVGAGLATIMTKQMAKEDFTGQQKSMDSFMPLCIMWGGAASIFLFVFAKVLVWFGSGFQVDYLDAWFANPLMDPNWAVNPDAITDATYRYINGHILSQAAWFIRIQAIGTIPYVYICAGVIMLRVQGKAQYATIFSTAGLVTNMLFDFMLIMVFKMNVVGAAIATVIGQSVNAIIYWYYFKYKAEIKCNKMDWNNSIKITKEVFVSGISIMMLQVITGMVLIIFTFSIGVTNYGYLYTITNYTAVYQGFNSLFIFCNLMIIAVAQSMKPIVEYNYLTDNKENVKKAKHLGFGIGMAFSAFVTIVICSFSKDIIGMFYSVDGTSIDYITTGFVKSDINQNLLGANEFIKTDGMDIAGMIVWILFMSFPVATALSLSGAYIQALGDNKKTITLLFGKLALLLPIILILGFLIPSFASSQWIYTISDGTNDLRSTSVDSNLNIFVALPITDAIMGMLLIYFIIDVEKNIFNKMSKKKKEVIA